MILNYITQCKGMMIPVGWTKRNYSNLCYDICYSDIFIKVKGDNILQTIYIFWLSIAGNKLIFTMFTKHEFTMDIP